MGKYTLSRNYVKEIKMKKLVKVVLAASIFLIPINKVDADSYPVYTKTISFNKNESINVNGKKYYDSGYVGTQRGLNKYDGLILSLIHI